MDDTAIDSIVRRLARPMPSGGHVIERASLLAEGSHFSDIEAWILKSGGEPEADAPEETHGGGVYGGRERSFARIGSGHPARYILPPDALSSNRTV